MFGAWWKVLSLSRLCLWPRNGIMGLGGSVCLFWQTGLAYFFFFRYTFSAPVCTECVVAWCVVRERKSWKEKTRWQLFSFCWFYFAFFSFGLVSIGFVIKFHTFNQYFFPSNQVDFVVVVVVVVWLLAYWFRYLC